MYSILEKSPNPSRALVFELLVSSLFTTNAETCSDCPLKEIRGSLSVDKKHEYVMGLSNAELDSFLTQHEPCYEKRLFDLDQW